MKNMGAIPVNLNALYLFRVDIAANMGPFVDDEAALSTLCRLIGKYRPIEARSYNKVIIHGTSPFPL